MSTIAVPSLPLSIDFDIMTLEGMDEARAQFREEGAIRTKEFGTVIIALDCGDDKYLNSLAKQYGEEAIPDLHITLLMVGNVADVDKDKLVAAVEQVAERYGPLEGKYNGIALFTDTGTEKPAHVLLYDAPGLPALHMALMLNLQSFRESASHGFTAHTTLAYSDKDFIEFDSYDKTFDSVSIFYGDEHISIPLSGEFIYKGGEGSGFYDHSGRPGKVGGSSHRFSDENRTQSKDHYIRVYHGTSESFLQSIFDEGLLRKSGNISTAYDARNSVFFTTDRFNAKAYGESAAEHAGATKYAVLQIAIPKDVENSVKFDELDFELFGQEHNYRLEMDIPPEWIFGASVYDIVDDSRVWIPRESKEITYYTVIVIDESDTASKESKDVTVLKQLPIDDESKKRLIEIRRNMFNDEVDTLSERMFTGQVSLGQWEESMKKYIRELHTSVAAIGKGGWDQMTQADWGRLGPVMKEQYRYLHGFAEKVAMDRDTISLKAIQARAHLYGNAAGYSAYLIQAGDAIAKQLPWMPKDGSTTCLVGCKCRWVLRVIDKVKDFQIVQAVWTLSEAEHCHADAERGTDGCVDRNGHVEILRVHESIDVPESIGGY